MKNILLTICILTFACICHAQSLTDAVRYSRYQVAGTARTAGVGGSFGAMGGDFGSLNINPAGIGDFYKSQFGLGVSYNSASADAFLVKDPEMLQNVIDNTLNINHIGYVKANRPSGSLLTSNIMVGFSQLSNLSEEISYTGRTRGTITERFAEVANSISPDALDPFEGGVAFDAGAIFDKEGDNFYETDFLDTTSLIMKNQYVDRVGRINEISLGWAGNYDNFLNFGMSVSIPFVSFEEYKVYEEDDPNGEQAIFHNLIYNENLSTSGSGVNFKLGMVAKIANALRLGVAFHSPTWYTFSDDYDTELTYSFNEGSLQTFMAESGDGSFRYKLLTPLKIIASGGYILNLSDEIKGFVNADVEFQNYSKADFDFTTFSESPAEASYQTEVNNDIRKELDQSISARIGAELAYRVLRLRLGFSGDGSPYAIDDKAFSRTTISGGVGFRFDKFFIDITGYNYSDEEGFYPYRVLTDGRNSLVNVDKNTFKMMLSMGFMF